MIRDYVDIANEYAERVLRGTVPACEYVKQAARRHLDDLAAASGGDDFPFVFDETAAIVACRIIELMPFTKGKWAREGRTIRMSDWQVFITACVFGWKRVRDGLRRYRIVYVEVPRKNGKSEWSAAVALYMFAADGEHGAEVYSGATTEKQAKIVFTAAQRMARKTEAFREAFGVEVMASNMSIPENGSKFEPLIGKPGDGASPSCAIVDEYHEHATDHLYDSMETGMGAREQPLMWVITTAGSDISGPCYELRSDVIRTLEGTLKNDELFGIIYTIDKDDDWTSEEALIKANPNLGVSVDGDYLRRQIRDAVANSRRQNITKTKHLNVWVQAREAWMNMEAWNRQAREMTEDEFAGEPCWMGLDLASKIDIASAVKVFRRGEEWFVFGRHYLPEDRIEDVENRHYQKWLTDGHLQGTEGDIIDHDAIEADIAEDAERHKLLTVGYDPYNATQLAVNLTRRRIETLEIRQTAKFLSDPMKWIEALVLAGNLWHDGNAAMTWMMSNVVARVDANDNVFPRKERAENKIDGPVALIIAMNVAMRESASGPSVYQSRGIRTL